MDTLRIESDTRIVWLNLSGSGNETAAHLREVNRMTLMFCAFEGDAMILRVYGRRKRFIHAIRAGRRRPRAFRRWRAADRFSISQSTPSKPPAAQAFRSCSS